jgi:hypothetical protein
MERSARWHRIPISLRYCNTCEGVALQALQVLHCFCNTTTLLRGVGCCVAVVAGSGEVLQTAVFSPGPGAW